MAEKLVIEIYRNKNSEELTKLIADPGSRLETGSGAALTAAVAAAYLCRAAAVSAGEKPGERADYILRNAEILRGYMVHLIDEDVKSRGPLNRALKEGGEREIEAARQPAVSISGEIVNMMGKCLELCPPAALHYVRESAETAMAAARTAVHYILDMSAKCSDETYRFVIHRENEITLGRYQPIYAEIVSQ